MTLPFFGIALCAVVVLGLYAAHQAQDELTKMASKGAIGNTGFVRYGGRLVPILITWLFLLGWVGVYFLT